MHLIAKAIRISRVKFHCDRLTTIRDYASLIFLAHIVEWCAYQMVKIVWWYVEPFQQNTSVWTDGQTDILWLSQHCLCRAWHRAVKMTYNMSSGTLNPTICTLSTTAGFAHHSALVSFCLFTMWCICKLCCCKISVSPSVTLRYCDETAKHVLCTITMVYNGASNCYGSVGRLAWGLILLDLTLCLLSAV